MLENVALWVDDDAQATALTDAFRAALPASARVCRVRDAAELEPLHDPHAPAPLVVVTEDAGDPCLARVATARRVLPEAVLVVALAHADVDGAARAAEAGADDLLEPGPRLEARVRTLLARLRRTFEVVASNRELHAWHRELHDSVRERTRLVGQSPRMQRLLAHIERVAAIPRPLLISGERGTGKELVARAIHLHSGLPLARMVTVNCAAIGEALLESELFGHEKGAFTGALGPRIGRFEQADGGTLFLDEIGNMPLPFQQKILRVVEYGTFTPVGSTVERKTSARIIAATNADLREKIAAGEFLGDLYDRLTFEVIEIPPLRERPGDVEALAQIFLDQFAAEIPAFRGKRLARSALAMLRAHPFPGNVRELKNIIERAACRDTTNEITPEDIGPLHGAVLPAAGGFKAQLDALARQLLETALRDARGNGAEAARRLELSYDQFRHYRRKHGI